MLGAFSGQISFALAHQHSVDASIASAAGRKQAFTVAELDPGQFGLYEKLAHRHERLQTVRNLLVRCIEPVIGSLEIVSRALIHCGL